MHEIEGADELREPQPSAFIPCTEVRLPDHLIVPAALLSSELNPENQPTTFLDVAHALDLKPQHIALLTGKNWPTGTVLPTAFVDNPPADLRDRLLGHMNAWTKTANIRFALSDTDPVIRVARSQGQGYWSYLGNDIRMIPRDQITMNLDSFTMAMPESEFRRVVRHEAGHTLANPHEHMRRELVERIDPNKAIAYFGATQGWSAQEVMQQVLTPLDESLITTSGPASEISIMTYSLPGSITIDGRPIVGGTDITDDDYAFMGRIYPYETVPPVTPPAPPKPPTPTTLVLGGPPVDGAISQPGEVDQFDLSVTGPGSFLIAIKPRTLALVLQAADGGKLVQKGRLGFHLPAGTHDLVLALGHPKKNWTGEYRVSLAAMGGARRDVA